MQIFFHPSLPAVLLYNRRVIKSITNYLSSPQGQTTLLIAGLLIALCAWLFPFQTEVKSLKVGLVSNLEPINISGIIEAENLKIFYQNREIESLIYLRFRIQNNGNLSILDNDYKEPLQIIFPSSVSIFDYSISDTTILSAVIESENILKLDAKLLNPGDVVDVEILVETTPPLSSDQIRLGGRIVGISSLSIEEASETDILSASDQRSHARKQLLNSLLGIGIAIVFFASMIPILYLMNYRGENPTLKILSKIIMFIFIAVFLSIIVFYVAYFLYALIITIIYAI